MLKKSFIFSLFFLVFSQICFSYGKPFSFRVFIKPPETSKTKSFNVYLSAAKINFKLESEKWSEWLNVDAEGIAAIEKLYPNLYLRRYPLVIGIGVSPAEPDTKVLLEFDVDGNKYSSEILFFGHGGNIKVVQWEENKVVKMATTAQYNQKYWKHIDEAAKEIGEIKRPEKLVIVDRFIGGSGDFYEWKEGLDHLAKIGFNSLLMPADASLRQLLLKTEIKKIAYAVYNPPGYAFDFDEKTTSDTEVRQWAEKIAEGYKKAGYDLRDITHFAVSDEPGWYFPSVFKPVIENPENLKRFHSYLKRQGLTPRDFGYQSWEWDKVKSIGRSVANKELPLRKLYYWSVRFIADVSHKYFARVTRILEDIFYPGMPVTVNWNFFAGRFYFPGPFAHNPDKKSPDAAMGSHDWLEFGRERGSNCLWTEDWFGDGLAYQWSFYASKLKSAARKSNVEFGGYVIGRTAGDGVTQKMMAIFGHGGKVIKFYVFGPEYNFPGNCWSENPKVIKGTMRAATMAAKAEELLYPGRPLISKVAILTPQSSLVWDQKEMEIASGIVDATNVNQNNATTTYMAEVYNLYLALMHANIPADFVDETDLLDQKLMSNYKVLFITAPNLPVECIREVQKWVNAGGFLVTTYGAITADRYDDPNNSFYQSLGIKIDQPIHPRVIVSWNKYKDSVVDTLEHENGIKVVWAKGKIIQMPVNAHVLSRFSDATPASIFVPSGKGGVFHFAFYPGCSYMLSQIEAEKKGFNGLPNGFSPDIRNLIVSCVEKAKVERYVSVSQPMIEAVPLVSEKGIAITVLNWSGIEHENISLEIKCDEKIKVVESISSGSIPFNQQKGVVSCQIPLKDVDVLLLKK